MFIETLILELFVNIGAFIRWLFIYRTKRSLKSLLEYNDANRLAAIAFFGIILTVISAYIIYINQ